MTIRRSPLHAWHQAQKARLVPFAGWEMPVQYSSIVEEHRAVRQKAGLFDVSHMARLSFAGPDAETLLERVCTNAIHTMKDFQVRYSLICNPAGGILDDVLVYRWPTGWAMVVNAGNREKIVHWLLAESTSLQVQIDDQTESTVMLAIQGPEAIERSKGQFRDDGSALKYYTALPTKFQDKPAVISRTGYTGEDGFEFIVSADKGVELANQLLARGAMPCGLGARDTLRLEAAMPLYGHELTEAINPIEAGLSWAVKLDKADFVGKSAIVQAKTRQERIRIGLKLEGKRAAREGSTIHVGTQTVGMVTSGSFVPHLEQSIAMGMIALPHSKVDSVVEVDIRGSRTPAVVVPLPFYRRR